MCSQIAQFLNQIAYKLGLDYKKQHDITSIHFWYKQLFHLTGGLILGFATGHQLYFFLSAAILLLPLLVALEVDDYLNGQSWYKTVLDCLFWTVGYIVPHVFIY